MVYLMIKNNETCAMEKVAEFVSLGDAVHVAKKLNAERILMGDTVHKYGVTNNPMIWKEI